MKNKDIVINKAKIQKGFKWIVIFGLVICGITIVVIIYALFGDAFKKPDVDTDISNYELYIGESAKSEYKNKMNMDESIFPKEITDDMSVKEYKMVYYNPWDPQYLSYLVIEYSDADYESELSRLESYGIEAYQDYYGAQGFTENYELLAMNADEYSGFIYALASQNNQIIYVELLFCNYFMDIDYRDYIYMEYLPIGFDASKDNDYRKEHLN